MKEITCNKCDVTGFNEDHLETHYCTGLEVKAGNKRDELIYQIVNPMLRDMISRTKALEMCKEAWDACLKENYSDMTETISKLQSERDRLKAVFNKLNNKWVTIERKELKQIIDEALKGEV